MIRKTSIDPYHKIKSEGLLSEKRMDVYIALYEHGPCTGMELLQWMNKSTRVDSQVRARLNELKKLGVAKEVGERKCSISGQNVILWAVTDQLPFKPIEIDQHNILWICDKCGMSFFNLVPTHTKIVDDMFGKDQWTTCYGKLEKYRRCK